MITEKVVRQINEAKVRPDVVFLTPADFVLLQREMEDCCGYPVANLGPAGLMVLGVDIRTMEILPEDRH